MTGTGKAGWAEEPQLKRLWPLLSLWQCGAGELVRGPGPRAEGRLLRPENQASERSLILRQFLQERMPEQLLLTSAGSDEMTSHIF